MQDLDSHITKETALKLSERSPLYINGLQPVIWRPGQTLMLEGAAADRVTLLHYGKVHKTQMDSTGKERLTVLSGPVILGYETLTGENPYFDSTAVTWSPGVGQIADIPTVISAMLNADGQHPDFALAALGDLTGQTRETYTSLGIRSFGHAFERSLATMARLADEEGSIEGYTQEKLAKIIGLSRVQFNQALSTLRRLGRITQGERGKRHHVLTDIANLTGIVDKYLTGRQKIGHRFGGNN